MDREIEDDVGSGAGGRVQEVYMRRDWKCELEHLGGRRHLGGRAESQGSVRRMALFRPK